MTNIHTHINNKTHTFTFTHYTPGNPESVLDLCRGVDGVEEGGRGPAVHGGQARHQVGRRVGQGDAHNIAWVEDTNGLCFLAKNFYNENKRK